LVASINGLVVDAGRVTEVKTPQAMYNDFDVVISA